MAYPSESDGPVPAPESVVKALDRHRPSRPKITWAGDSRLVLPLTKQIPIPVRAFRTTRSPSLQNCGRPSVYELARMYSLTSADLCGLETGFRELILLAEKSSISTRGSACTLPHGAGRWSLASDSSSCAPPQTIHREAQRSRILLSCMPHPAFRTPPVGWGGPSGCLD